MNSSGFFDSQFDLIFITCIDDLLRDAEPPKPVFVEANEKSKKLLAQARASASHFDLPELTSRGGKIHHVAVFGMVSGVCQSSDWRGELPKFLLGFLPKASGVVINIHQGSWACSFCNGHGQPRQGDYASSDCNKYIGHVGSRKPVGLVLVIGSGLQRRCGKKYVGASCTKDKYDPDPMKHYPDILDVFHSGLIDENTITIHVPIRKDNALKEPGAVYPFQHAIHDDGFLKPMANSMIQYTQQACASEQKTNSLMYVGRYVQSKGQVDFLKKVDPMELQGFNIQFYGGDYYFHKYREAMVKIAKDKGISITVHDEVDLNSLLRSYCRASGQIHFSPGDNVSIFES